jgi:hypothetical protein
LAHDAPEFRPAPAWEVVGGRRARALRVPAHGRNYFAGWGGCPSCVDM